MKTLMTGKGRNLPEDLVDGKVAPSSIIVDGEDRVRGKEEIIVIRLHLSKENYLLHDLTAKFAVRPN